MIVINLRLIIFDQMMNNGKQTNQATMTGIS